MIVSVVNAKADMMELHRGEYIGRGNRRGRLTRSPLANPFKIGRDGDREQVIAKYRDWLHCRIQAGDREVLNELARLTSIVERTGKLVLACWCAPLPCHGDVIKATIEEVLREEECA